MSDSPFALTPLIPVVEWIWHRYHVKFFTKEGGDLVQEIDFIGVGEPQCTDFDPQYGGLHWPVRANWFEWEVVEENVKVRVFRGRHCMQTEGDGWLRDTLKIYPE